MKPELTAAIAAITDMTALQRTILIGWLISAAKDTPAVERELIAAVRFATTTNQ
jgi:phage-related minor tail protein